MLFDDGFIESSRLLVLAFLHEKNVGDVQLPGVLIIAELDRLSEYLFHLRIVLKVPVDLCLLHQHGNVPRQLRRLTNQTISIDIASLN